MRAEEFLSLLKAEPFRPLLVHMTDGRTYEILHPDQVLVLRQRIDIGIPTRTREGILDRVEHCSLLHVVRVEERPAA